MEDNVKRTCLALALLSFAHGLSAAEPQAIELHGFADMSCGAWASSSSDEFQRAQYLTWFRGFVSGSNFSDPQNQISAQQMPSRETIALFVDKYCRENPLNPFTAAAISLVEQLREGGRSS